MSEDDAERPPAASEPDLPLPDTRDDTALGIWIARRYYLEDQSKVQIAKELGISRFQVARLLTDARRRGIVRIEIGSPGRIDRELSVSLQTALELPRAVVVETQPEPPGSALRHVGAALAEVLAETVEEGNVVGLGWSRAIESMAGQLGSLPPCTVVQLGGALHLPAATLGSVEVVRRVAAVADGTAHPIYAPLVVDDPATANGLRRQPEIASTLARGDDLDLAVLSVGAWRPSASSVYDAVEHGIQQEGVDQGVCGEIGGRLFDADGAPVRTSLDGRLVGVTSAQLRKVPHLITTSYGAYRAAATIAAVRAGLVTTLITDDELARTVLA